jgi:ataxin-3
VFAVRPSQEGGPLELPRTEADTLAAAIPEPSATARAAARIRMQSTPASASGTATPGSGVRSPSSTAATAAAGDVDWMADEDMELQAALQASLIASGGEGSWTPPPADPPVPPLHEAIPATRNRFEAPGAFPDDDELDDDGHDEAELAAEREARELEAQGDAVGAGMARSRAKLARFQRHQAAAARGLDQFRGASETPAQREVRERRQRENEEEEEMLRRAIEESRLMAEASGSHADDVPMEDVPVPTHGTWDGEDDDLQAALRASLLKPEPSGPQASESRPKSVARSESMASVTTESEAGTEDGKEAPAAQETVEEMRKKRLARFGA